MNGGTSVALDVRSLENPFSSYARVIRLIRLACAAVDVELKEWREGACGAEVLWTPGPTLPQASDHPRLLITVQDLNPMLPDGRPRWARWRRARRYRRMIQEIDRVAWRIAVPSDSTELHMQQALPQAAAARVKIPWFASPEFTPPNAGATSRPLHDLEPGYLLYVGALRQHKNWPVVLQAFAALPAGLRQQHPLVMLGSRHRSGGQARALCARLGIEAEVRWLDGLPDSALPALYRQASVFLFPSLLEGFGLPPLEAQACATPVIAAATTSLPEVLGDGAMLLPPTDVTAWTEAVRLLLQDSPAAQELRRRGLANAARYSPKVTGQALLRALQS